MAVTHIKWTHFPHSAIMYHCIPADGQMRHLPPCFLDIWLEIVMIIFSFLSADTMCLLREISGLNAIKQRIWEAKFTISSWIDIFLVKYGENWTGLDWTGPDRTGLEWESEYNVTQAFWKVLWLKQDNWIIKTYLKGFTVYTIETCLNCLQLK